jgi:predicted N-acyltransferase
MLTCLAAQVNQGLCTRFAVQYYPTLLWASPPTLAQGDRLTKAEELDELKNAHSAEKLLERINERVAKYLKTASGISYLLTHCLRFATINGIFSEIHQRSCCEYNL